MEVKSIGFVGCVIYKFNSIVWKYFFSMGREIKVGVIFVRVFLFLNLYCFVLIDVL